MKFNAEGSKNAKVVLLCGDESIERNKAFKELVALIDTGDGFDREDFEADRTSLADAVAAASQMPFFAEKRLVIFRHVGRVSPEEPNKRVGENAESVKQLRAIPDSGMVLMVSDDESGDSDQQDKFNRNTDNWSKAIQLAGGQVHKFTSVPGDVVKTIQEVAKQNGKQINQSTALLLSQMAGGSMSVSLNELEKVMTYLGDHATITVDDVKNVVAAELEYKSTVLIEAVVQGRAAEATRQLRILVGGMKSDSDAGIMLLGLLNAVFRNAIQARVALDNGGSPGRIPDSIKQILPRQNISTDPDWKQGKAFQTARKFTLEQLEQCLVVLLETDASLKGQRPGGRILDVLEVAVLELCRIGTGKETITV